MNVSKSVCKFPSQFVSPEVKNSEKYCKQYSDAFHTEAAYLPTETALCRTNKNYKRWRQYSRGEQSNLQYKEWMGLKRSKDGQPPNTSYRNLNYENLKVAPKLRNIVVNKVMNQPFRMKANPIDPRSISKRRNYKSKLLEFVVNKEEIERFEQLTKLGLSRPVPPGELPPMSAAEIDPYIEMNPKDITCMEVLDFIRLGFYENNWTQQGREIIGDIFDLGIGGTRQFIDADNKIKFKRVLPERSIANKCIYPDFRDLIRFGEYHEITVSELKRRTKNKWGEKVYQEIANKVAEEQNKYSGNVENFYDATSYTYAYDHEKVTVLDCMWYSTDTEVHIEYLNEAGNKRIKQERFDYVPFRGDKNVNDGKGLSDKEYNELNAGKKRIYRTEVRNVYQCSWIVDTDYVYDHGLMKNMLRSSTNWQESILPVTLISTDFISTVGIIEQPLDQVQLNYLQFQSHVSASKPPGIAIEKHALARVGKGGQGGKKWDPKEDLIMYAESGNLVYDGYDEHGNPLNQHPFKELENGLSPGAVEHFQLMLQWIDLIRDMLGLNIMTEGKTPPERLGKSVAEMAYGASDNALSHLTAAYKSVYERTARNMFYLLQNNIHRMNPDMISESLGSESYKYFMLNQDLGLMDMGIILEEGPDDVVKERIAQTLNLMVENQEIPGEDAIMIQMMDNPYRQILMIRKHRLEREAKRAMEQERLVTLQGDKNTETAVAAEEAAQKGKEADFEMRMREKEIDAAIKERDRDKEFMYEVLIKKLDNDKELQQHEKDLLNNLLTKIIDSETSLKKQRLANEKKPQAV